MTNQVNVSELDQKSKPILSLLEYGEKEFKGYDILEKDEELREFLTTKGIGITTTRQGLKISANSHIGTAEFSNFILTVNPKFTNLKNIGRLIDYGYQIDEKDIPDFEIKFEEGKNQPLELIILLFIIRCSKLLRKGLSKSYLTHQDSLPYLRGKLLISQQLQNQAKFNLKFACEYDEFTSDNVDNQIILYCLEKCYHLTESRMKKDQIQKLIRQMPAEIQLRPIEREDFRNLSYTRLNHHYKKPHQLAELILSSLGLLDFRRPRTSFVVPFFIKMYDVFEKFLTNLFCDYYYNDMLVKGQVRRSAWKVDNEDVPIIPDIIIYDGKNMKKDSEVSIIDAKYMTADKFGAGKEEYQIAFYLNEYNKKIGYAILPRDKGEKRPKITWEAPNQNLVIYLKFIDIDTTLDLIYSKEDRTKEIKNMLYSLIPKYPDMI